MIYADFYAGDRGGFILAPGTVGGPSQGLLATSTNTAVASLQAVQRGWFQRLALRADSAVSATAENPGGWFLRHGWSGDAAGNTPRSAQGCIGFWARTTAAGVQGSMAINAPGPTARGVRRLLVADGAWHLYEWDFLNGAQWEPLAGGDGRFSAGTFTLDSIQLFGRINDAVVDLDLVAHNAFGSLAALLPNDSGRLVNASVRGTLTTVDPLLAVGLTVGAGTPATKPVLLRAAGPSLAALEVTGALPDPRLVVFDARGATLATNERWGGTAVLVAAAARVGAFPFASGASLDAAALVPLSAGSQIVEVSSSTGATGVTVVEVYDTTETLGAESPRLLNLAARGRAGAGIETLVVGFVVHGGPKRVLLRAVGPGLVPFGVTGALADPQLTLFAGAALHALNDDWGGGPVLTDIFTRTGAFALGGTSRDAAVLVALPPGAYAAHVRGANATTGVVLLEIYEVP